MRRGQEKRRISRLNAGNKHAPDAPPTSSCLLPALCLLVLVSCATVVQREDVRRLNALCSEECVSSFGAYTGSYSNMDANGDIACCCIIGNVDGEFQSKKIRLSICGIDAKEREECNEVR